MDSAFFPQRCPPHYDGDISQKSQDSKNPEAGAKRPAFHEVITAGELVPRRVALKARHRSRSVAAVYEVVEVSREKRSNQRTSEFGLKLLPTLSCSHETFHVASTSIPSSSHLLPRVYVWERKVWSPWDLREHSSERAFDSFGENTMTSRDPKAVYTRENTLRITQSLLM